MSSSYRLNAGVAAAVVLLAGPACDRALAQGLRFENHREVTIPKYAVLRVGPFYSNIAFSQSAGARYVSSSGSGTQYLLGGNRGPIREDGIEYPLVSSLDFRNYLLVTRNMDVDLSVRVSYSHFPMETQEDEFLVDLAEEGIAGNLTTEFELTPFIKGSGYDRFFYRTDYVDTRGIEDRQGGTEFENINNAFGAKLDWLMAPDHNLWVDGGREDVIPLGDTLEDQERYSYSESVGYEQRLARFVLGGIKAAFEQNYYAADTRPDTTFSEYSAYTAARLTEQSVGNLSLGYSQVSESGPAAAEETDGNESGIAASASLLTDMTRRLKQQVNGSIGRQRGFDSPYNLVSAGGYRLDYKGDVSDLGVFTDYTDVQPGGAAENTYSDWRSGVTATYRITEDIPMTFSSVYSVRSNGDMQSTNAPVENLADYDTWDTKLNFGCHLLQDVRFDAYVEHVERISDSADLEYTRDILGATLTYTHQF